VRFDDEVTRFGLYRNFFDPYGREWQHGNSRWDVIDMVRLTRALRPEGIQWPTREDGAPSFRLEELTTLNSIAHEGAHDALADVVATIGMARLVRERQPRLYDYVFANRGKRQAAALLNWRNKQMVLHVSRRIPAGLGCISPVVPLSPHPRNRNSVICFDLRHDPAPVVALDPDTLRERLYTPTAELGEDEDRIGLKEIHLNKCPVIVPVTTLTPEAASEWGIDLDQAQVRRDRLAGASGLAGRLAAVYGDAGFPPEPDPDLALYDGLLSDGDRRRGEEIRNASPGGLRTLRPAFDDPRLAELLFRYRARNWPETLSAAERERWDDYRRERLRSGDASSITLGEFRERVAALRQQQTDGSAGEVLDALAAWPAGIGLAG
jgi:exodeoxyribonuclease-1